MTDWQIIHLLGEERSEEKEVTRYDELFHWAWSARGYSDSEIQQIWEWKEEEGSTDESVWENVVAAGFARG